MECWGIYLIIIVAMLYDGMSKFKNKPRLSIEQIKNFDSYLTVLNYHMEKAYDIIYKDRILVYSIDGFKAEDHDIDIISKDFCNLSLKLIGSSLKREFIFLYGDEETLLLNIIDFFNSKYEEDDIRESALNNMIEGKDEGVKD